jgi:hypothetical protein
VPAVPSPSGVADVFAFQNDGTVQAITSDGTTAWTADLSRAYGWASQGYIMPDFQGGLTVMMLDYNDSAPYSIVKFDGITGQPYPAYSPGETSMLLPYGPWWAVHPDGTIFALQENSNSDAVIGIDPSTGTQKFSVPLPMKLFDDDLPVYSSFASALMVAGDGYAYLPYGYREWPSNGHVLNHFRVLRVNSSGTYDNIDILDWAQGLDDPSFIDGIEYWAIGGISAITNADQGILLAWAGSDSTFGMAITTGASASLVRAPQIPGQSDAVVPVLQAQDGSFVGYIWTGPGYTTQYMVAFDATGNVRWSVPNEQPQIATADGGVIGQSGVTYDQNENATGQLGSLPTQSWTGNMYQDGPVEQLAILPFLLATSFCVEQGGNLSRTPTAAEPLPDRVLALYDVVGPDPLGNGSVLREIEYTLYQGTKKFAPDKNTVIQEKLIYSYGQEPLAGRSPAGQPFDDFIGARGKGPFGLTQQFTVSPPGTRAYRVQIEACNADGTFGKPSWQNINIVTSQTVLVNGDPGSTTARTCKQN